MVPPADECYCYCTTPLPCIFSVLVDAKNTMSLSRLEPNATPTQMSSNVGVRIANEASPPLVCLVESTCGYRNYQHVTYCVLLYSSSIDSIINTLVFHNI